MLKFIIVIVAAASCLISLWKSIDCRSHRFDKVFFGILSIAFLVIGIIFNNSI